MPKQKAEYAYGKKRSKKSKRSEKMTGIKSSPKPLARLENSLTSGNIWLSALSLMKRKKVYAYALPREIKNNFGFEPSRLMTYFVLYKLESDGFVMAKFEGRRKYYEITAAGRKLLLSGKQLLSIVAKKL